MTTVFGELSFVPSLHKFHVHGLHVEATLEDPVTSEERPPVTLVSKEDRADTSRSPRECCGTEIANANACGDGAAITNKRSESAGKGRARH